MEAVITHKTGPQIHNTLFGVQGMTCSACTHTIHDAFDTHPAIESVSVSLLNNSMRVIYDANGITPLEIITRLDELGYDGTEYETSTGTPEMVLATADREIMLLFDGMANTANAKAVNDYLQSLPIISFTAVTLQSPIATIRYTPIQSLTVRTILDGVPTPIKASFYRRPSSYSRSREIQRKEGWKMIRLWLLSFLFAVPTFVFGIVGAIILPKSHWFRMWCMKADWWGGASRVVILLFIFATIVQFGIARIFFVHGWASLRFRKGWKGFVRFGNMDLLVALSTGTAYIASIIMMVIDIRMPPGDGPMEMRSYFEAVILLTFFILGGRALEARARLKTGDAIAMLGQLRPETAFLVAETDIPVDDEKKDRGDAKEIPVDMLEIGDLILIKPGSIPAADGVIVEGTTTVDESSLTGESVPVGKGPGDTIFTGTTVLSSAIVTRVERLGDATVLEQIVKAVGDSLDIKAPIEELADRITSVFVPVVIYLAIIVLATWLTLALIPGALPEWYLEGRMATADRAFFAFEFAIALLAIACPCGIGLAAPAAQAVGAGMAARAGILAQGGGTAFQAATEVDTVVFDKTGTLTQGQPQVVESEILVKDEPWILEAVRKVESTSSHPLAAALVQYAESADESREKTLEGTVTLVQVEEIAGRGAKGAIQVNDNRIISFKLGNEAMVEGATYANEEDGTSTLSDTWKQRGNSVVFLAISAPDSSSKDERYILAARFAIADPIREEAKSTLTSLRRLGKEVWLLSGDNQVTANAVGRELGLESERIVAGVLPQEKAKFIQGLRERDVMRRGRWGRMKNKKSMVMFVGDGLNDSAAVTNADVGVAFAHGSQITLTNASFVLMATKSPLSSILTVLTLSKRVYRRQKLNFVWAMIYNVAMIPLAAGAFYPLNRTRIPATWSAMAMALSR